MATNHDHDAAELSLDEKTALLSGQDFWTTKPSEQAGIPALVLSDGPHGLRRQRQEADHLGLYNSEPATCFPPAVALASSWDPELVGRVGEALGREARALGVDVLLGPGVNIKRSPLCGRNFEYFSEDPLLSGVLGAAHVTGVQSQGVGASVKHFAANNQETDRMRVSADVDERTLREIYFPAFERIVTQARPATVMCSYNRVNGTYAAESRRLLTQVLREEWGFDGLVVSDWGAVGDRVAALLAGTDLEMPGNTRGTDADVAAAVRSGELEEAVVDTAVARLRELAGRVRAETGAPAVDFEAHHRLAREAAADCLVLLKNENRTLPLAPAGRIAVIGEFAASPRYQGGGSSHVNATRVDSPVDELRALLPRVQVDFAQGYDTTSRSDAARLREEAVALAAQADTAVLVIGLREADESEGYDREHLLLPQEHVELVHAVTRAARRTAVVLLNGGTVSLEGWHDEVDAVVEAWLPGQAAGGAIADVLTGRVNPSGRLAETIPLRLNDTPSFLNFPGEQGHVRYGEGVMVGYRYYETADIAVRHPFGHGLSYTTFEQTGFRVTATGPDTARVSVTVTNTGDRFGKHVVQIYVTAPRRPVSSPTRELRGFTKVALAPGESTTAEIALDRRAFAYWDISRDDWTVAPGQYQVHLAENAHDVVDTAALDLPGDTFVRPLTLDSTVSDWFGHPTVGPALNSAITFGLTEEQATAALEGNADALRMLPSMAMRRFLSFLPTQLPHEQLEQLMETSTAPSDPVGA
ncbi:glycoside hydrolase family 3 C-terminal domain-containing protein [Streptomyces sp. SP18BB07]|uniref:glycoside hydrolase family 3 C-terminal domain-containing protein n=1 Tax=Streptomyces sp. SP18BB07 TaxID=3002522 RepID=UPI002E764D3D|nr:glycoside hydrolase family 3 C-terminal domain-containing protein [Streptomyces sp. SP18BB07]MEE1760861.1 glycoside hydrolase family 3 C-terminal domain-containing protein [Streptomyces sp. SP18BB07]